jgi:cell division protein FtsW
MALEKFRKRSAGPDYLLIIVIFALIIFGLVMVYAASAYTAEKTYGVSSYFFKKQFVAFIVGIVMWLIFSKIDYNFWKKNAFILLIITIILLVAVFIPGIGINASGASRWLDVGFTQIQPAEIAKLFFIIYLSAWLSKKGEGIRDFKGGFVPFVSILAIISLLIIKQPDMGTMSIIVIVSSIMFIVAGASWAHIITGMGLGLSFLFILIKSAPYRFQRLMTFLNPTSDSLGASYHINQSLIAIGTGGLFGLGFGQSKQKLFYLPEAQTDSIFAIITEELGFLRAMLVILVFVFIAYRGLKIAKNAPDDFSRLLAVGITSWIIVQAFLNLSAMLGLVPLTGIPLPFVSYGGTSLVVLLMAVGILTNISKQANRQLNN